MLNFTPIVFDRSLRHTAYNISTIELTAKHITGLSVLCKIKYYTPVLLDGAVVWDRKGLAEGCSIADRAGLINGFKQIFLKYD